MRLVRFLSRVAFICNICFLAAAFTQWLPQLPDNGLTSTFITMGYVLSIIFNVLVNMIVIILFLIGRLRAAGIRPWLLIVNLIFFVIQIVLLYINYHPQ